MEHGPRGFDFSLVVPEVRPPGQPLVSTVEGSCGVALRLTSAIQPHWVSLGPVV